MHHVDFARLLLRQLDEMLAPLSENILAGAPRTLEAYREAVAQRRAYDETRQLIVRALGRDAEELT